MKFDRRILLLVPAVLLLLVFFLYPVGTLLLRSFTDPELGLQNYQVVVDQPIYGAAMWNTVQISAGVTIICILIGYPFAYTMAHVGPGMRRFLIFVVLIPFWSSILVRSFAWMVLLQRRGLVNDALIWLGLTDAPLSLIHNRVGVLIGMSHIMLPFMVLPLYAVMTRIDATYVKAAASLGAPPVRAFFRIYLPLSRPGLVNGAALVFVLGLGYFIVPALLGGRADTMIAQLIQSQIAQFGDWGLAGALSVTLLLAVAVTFALVRRSAVATARTI